MYDFQIVNDVNIALDTLNMRLARVREWRARQRLQEVAIS